MSALPDPDQLDVAGYVLDARTFNDAYQVGYVEGFAAGMASERDAIAKRLAADVARQMHEHATWTSVKSGRKLKTDAGKDGS